MRRISLAVALIGAVAAAGCGGGSKPSSSGSKGTAGVNFTVTVNYQGPGTVTSTPSGLTCTPPVAPAVLTQCSGTFSSGTVVTVNATPNAGNYVSFYGDCTGTSCTLSGPADEFVVAYFSSSQGIHPNWAHGWDHGPRYEAFTAGVAGELQCTSCHGANLQGTSIVPACNLCHYFNGQEGVLPSAPSAQVMHFDSNAAAWDKSTSAHFLGNDCIRCHTNSGFSRWISAGSYLGNPAGTFVPAFTYIAGTDVGGPLKCETCHANNVLFGAAPVTKILFPSNVTVTAPDVATAVCGQCHMGRNSTAGVDATTGMSGAADTVPTTNISFPDEHYLAAAATLYGGVAKGWYQYAGKIYTGQNEHGGVGSCVYCHDPHNGQLPADGTGDMKRLCGKCHFGDNGQPVSTFAQLEESRQFGFEGDIDGDGTVESLKAEIDGLATKLAAAMSAYANQFSSTTNGICFSGAAYPYWYQQNASGACLDGIAATPKTSFAKFTPRLVRAAYNYKQYVKEPGAWAHNPRYVIEVLFDAFTDLNSALTTKIPFSGLRTTTQGHFGAATATKPLGSDAFTDWDAAGQIDAACSQCHGARTGLTNFIANQATTTKTPSIVAFECLACHAPVTGAAANFKGVRTDITTLYFPPAKTAANANQIQLPATTFPYAKDRVCATCHTGRENKTTIDLAIGTKVALDFSVAFKNPHYLGAAGVLLGSNTHMMYEYTGQTYATYPAFWGTTGAAPGPHGSPHGGSCTGCHNPQGSRHGFEIDLATSMPAGSTTTCNGCHVVEPFGDFRLEPVKANVGALAAELLAKINAYQVANGQNPVCYAGGAYPYWYVGTVNPGGVCGAAETTGYGSKWDAKTAKAVFNFQWSQKEPGAYAHNWDYIAQTLIDSIMDLDGSATLPCDAHDSLCLAPQIIDGALIAGGPAYTGSSFIVRP